MICTKEIVFACPRVQKQRELESGQRCQLRVKVFELYFLGAIIQTVIVKSKFAKSSDSFAVSISELDQRLHVFVDSFLVKNLPEQA